MSQENLGLKRHWDKLKTSTKVLNPKSYSRKQAAAVVLFLVAVGGIILYRVLAAGPFLSAEAESGAVTAPATIINDGTASGGKAIVFGAVCTGVVLINGQADINSHPGGTTYCLSGVHNNWTLSPHSGDQFIGDGTAVLDGANAATYAFLPTGTNVTIENLEIRNYVVGYQHGAIQSSGSANSAGWILRNLQVHDNGIVCATSSCGSNAGGYGASIGLNWQVLGGRYYNNRQSGLGAGGANGSVLDGVEIDHNNFTNSSYTTANNNCDDEAGAIKWAATTSFTVKNSKVHDNACRGLWGDINTNNSTVTNNNVYNNWADGIMIEISGGATITGNTVTGNAFKEFSGGTGACAWGYGAGIFISTSGKTATVEGTIDISNNDVEGNCSSITGVDEVRDGTQQLMHLRIHDNNVVASSNPKALNKFGVFPSPGDPLTTHDIIFGTGNVLSTGIVNCGFTCN